MLEPGDEVVVVDVAEGARPGLDHPVLRRLVDHHGLPVSAKLGWTDVARFAAAGHPRLQPRSRRRHPGPPGGRAGGAGALDRTYEVLAEVLQSG